jgi:DNA-binding NtrC family response regulator
VATLHPFENKGLRFRPVNFDGHCHLLQEKRFQRVGGLEIHNLALSLHSWPGNVRELQNRVRRAAIMADGKRVTSKDLELTDAISTLPPQTLKEARESFDGQTRNRKRFVMES